MDRKISTVSETEKKKPEFKREDIPYQIAYDAHRGMSLTPEDRAISEQDAYVAAMTYTYDKLALIAKTQNQIDRLNELMAEMRESFIEKYIIVLKSKSRCMSPMVTGPANFPVDRNRKAFAAADRKTLYLSRWLDKAVGRMSKEIRDAGVSEGKEEDEIAVLRKELERAERRQETMKNTNALFRRKTATKEEKMAKLREFGMSQDLQGVIIFNGFTPFALSSNLAKIKRIKEKIWSLERQRKEDQAQEGNREIPFPGGKVVDNKEIDRIQIIYDQRPSQEMIKQLKKGAFNWSPKNGAWQRKRTVNTRYMVGIITGVKI
jgi:hypothetical protein